MSSNMVGLRMPDDLYREVEREAELSGNSLQSVIRTILAKHYNYLPAKDENGEQNEPVKAGVS